METVIVNMDKLLSVMKTNYGERITITADDNGIVISNDIVQNVRIEYKSIVDSVLSSGLITTK